MRLASLLLRWRQQSLRLLFRGFTLYYKRVLVLKDRQAAARRPLGAYAAAALKSGRGGSVFLGHRKGFSAVVFRDSHSEDL